MNYLSIKKQFDYGNRIISLADIDDSIERIQKELEQLMIRKQCIKADLPNDIIEQYEQLRVVDKLRGDVEPGIIE